MSDDDRNLDQYSGATNAFTTVTAYYGPPGSVPDERLEAAIDRIKRAKKKKDKQDRDGKNYRCVVCLTLHHIDDYQVRAQAWCDHKQCKTVRWHERLDRE